MLLICVEIINDQIPQDTLGNFLCFNTRGASAVNLLVLNGSLVKNIVNLKVLPLNFDSNHAPITATFKSFLVKIGKGKAVNRRKTYKWNNQGAVLFHFLQNQKDTKVKKTRVWFRLI